MTLKDNSKLYLNEIKDKWLILHSTSSVFAYNLNVKQRKYLPGEHIFYTEVRKLNQERTSLRRLPQTICSLNPPFMEHNFNFTKINPSEHIMNIPYENIDVAVIINNSPLTMYHSLLCPDVTARYPQRMSLMGLRFGVAFLMELEQHAFRIGYNSPGALASVNHLHMHLVHIDTDLYIDKAELELIGDTYIYRLNKTMPTEAICFVINKAESEEVVESKLKRVYDFIMWLCGRNLPHNIFMTPERTGAADALKIFVYARFAFCTVKDAKSYNIGFCELSGYIPVGDQKLFDNLTEQHVVAKIRGESGEAYKNIYNYFKN